MLASESRVPWRARLAAIGLNQLIRNESAILVVTGTVGFALVNSNFRRRVWLPA